MVATTVVMMVEWRVGLSADHWVALWAEKMVASKADLKEHL
jgi:hypothetical protein